MLAAATEVQGPGKVARNRSGTENKEGDLDKRQQGNDPRDITVTAPPPTT